MSLFHRQRHKSVDIPDIDDTEVAVFGGAQPQAARAPTPQTQITFGDALQIGEEDGHGGLSDGAIEDNGPGAEAGRTVPFPEVAPAAPTIRPSDLLSDSAMFSDDGSTVTSPIKVGAPSIYDEPLPDHHGLGEAHVHAHNDAEAAAVLSRTISRVAVPPPPLEPSDATLEAELRDLEAADATNPAAAAAATGGPSMASHPQPTPLAASATAHPRPSQLLSFDSEPPTPVATVGRPRMPEPQPEEAPIAPPEPDTDEDLDGVDSYDEALVSSDSEGEFESASDGADGYLPDPIGGRSAQAAPEALAGPAPTLSSSQWSHVSASRETIHLMDADEVWSSRPDVDKLSAAQRLDIMKRGIGRLSSWTVIPLSKASGPPVPTRMRLDERQQLVVVEAEHTKFVIEIEDMTDVRVIPCAATMGDHQPSVAPRGYFAIAYWEEGVRNFVDVAWFCCIAKDEYLAEVWRRGLDDLISKNTWNSPHGASTSSRQARLYARCLAFMDEGTKMVNTSLIATQLQAPVSSVDAYFKQRGALGEDNGRSAVSALAFTFPVFQDVIRELHPREDIYAQFTELLAGQQEKADTLSLDTITRSIKLDGFEEHTYSSAETLALEIINRYEPSDQNSSQRRLSSEGFENYMLSEHGDLQRPRARSVFQDMNQPLNEYFVASSHNTYVTGKQVSGPSSVEVYRQALLSGCRCVELDCWDGTDGDPVITHTHKRAHRMGISFTSRISFEQVIEAVRDYAFKNSPYPVVLSLENHCSIEQQKRIAHYLSTILGDLLCRDHQCDQGEGVLPSPNDLKWKVIVKNYKSKSAEEALGLSEEEEEDVTHLECIAPELDDMVYFLAPRKFRGFELAKGFEYNEMTSISEAKAKRLVVEESEAFSKYNTRNISRVYPAANRVFSSNFNPQVFWNFGCQMVALNYHRVHRVEQRLNLAKFASNGRAGLVLKPRPLRNHNMCFDPFRKDFPTVAQDLEITVYSAPFTSGGRKPNPRVGVQLFGVPGDSRPLKKTHQVKANADFPRASEANVFLFSKLFVAELIMVYIAVGDDGELGYVCLPLNDCRAGFRHVYLDGASHPLASLCVKVTLTEHVDNEHVDFIHRITTPTNFSSSVAARNLKALEVLLQDDDLVRDENEEAEVFQTNMSRLDSEDHSVREGALEALQAESDGLATLQEVTEPSQSATEEESSGSNSQTGSFRVMSGGPAPVPAAADSRQSAQRDSSKGHSSGASVTQAPAPVRAPGPGPQPDAARKDRHTETAEDNGLGADEHEPPQDEARNPAGRHRREDEVENAEEEEEDEGARPRLGSAHSVPTENHYDMEDPYSSNHVYEPTDPAFPPTSPYSTKEVRVPRVNQKLGLSFAGDPSGEHKGLFLDACMNPHVDDLEPGSRLLSVNDHDVLNSTKAHGLQLLREAPEPIVLRFRCNAEDRATYRALVAESDRSERRYSRLRANPHHPPGAIVKANKRGSGGGTMSGEKEKKKKKKGAERTFWQRLFGRPGDGAEEHASTVHFGRGDVEVHFIGNDREGVYVRDVAGRGAKKAHLPVGARVLAVNGVEVTDAAYHDVIARVHAEEECELRVRTGPEDNTGFEDLLEAEKSPPAAEADAARTSVRTAAPPAAGPTPAGRPAPAAAGLHPSHPSHPYHASQPSQPQLFETMLARFKGKFGLFFVSDGHGHLPGVYVSSATNPDAAQLEPGSRVLMLNHQDVRSCTQEEITTLIREFGGANLSIVHRCTAQDKAYFADLVARSKAAHEHWVASASKVRAVSALAEPVTGVRETVLPRVNGSWGLQLVLDRSAMHSGVFIRKATNPSLVLPLPAGSRLLSINGHDVSQESAAQVEDFLAHVHGSFVNILTRRLPEDKAVYKDLLRKHKTGFVAPDPTGGHRATAEVARLADGSLGLLFIGDHGRDTRGEFYVANARNASAEGLPVGAHVLRFNGVDLATKNWAEFRALIKAARGEATVSVVTELSSESTRRYQALSQQEAARAKGHWKHVRLAVDTVGTLRRAAEPDTATATLRRGATGEYDLALVGDRTHQLPGAFVQSAPGTALVPGSRIVEVNGTKVGDRPFEDIERLVGEAEGATLVCRKSAADDVLYAKVVKRRSTAARWRRQLSKLSLLNGPASGGDGSAGAVTYTTVPRINGRANLSYVSAEQLGGEGIYVHHVADTALAKAIPRGSRVLAVNGQPVAEFDAHDVTAMLRHQTGDNFVLATRCDRADVAAYNRLVRAHASEHQFATPRPGDQHAAHGGRTTNTPVPAGLQVDLVGDPAGRLPGLFAVGASDTRVPAIERGSRLVAVDGRDISGFGYEAAADAVLASTADPVVLTTRHSPEDQAVFRQLLFEGCAVPITQPRRARRVQRKARSRGSRGIEQTTLHKTNGSCGLCLAADKRHDGVFVESVSNPTVTGLRIGSRVLAINGTDVRACGLVEVNRHLQAAGDPITLQTRRSPVDVAVFNDIRRQTPVDIAGVDPTDPTHWHTLTIRRHPGEEFGIQLLGEHLPGPIFVLRPPPNSPAARASLRGGVRILRINGVDTESIAIDDARNLYFRDDHVTLTVGQDPEGYADMAERLDARLRYGQFDEPEYESWPATNPSQRVYEVPQTSLARPRLPGWPGRAIRPDPSYGSSFAVNVQPSAIVEELGIGGPAWLLLSEQGSCIALLDAESHASKMVAPAHHIRKFANKEFIFAVEVGELNPYFDGCYFLEVEQPLACVSSIQRLLHVDGQGHAR